jgi:nucleotide-binding universal stress UspA family protein
VTIKNILLATDFTACSDRAADDARECADRFGATLHLLHVVTDPLHLGWDGYSRAADLMDEVDTLKASAEQQLRRLGAQWGELRGRIETATAFGDPADEVLKYARAHDIGLIVCGTHSRRGLERAIMGSVAEKLVRRATCPVLTVGMDCAKAARAA